MKTLDDFSTISDFLKLSIEVLRLSIEVLRHTENCVWNRELPLEDDSGDTIVEKNKTSMICSILAGPSKPSIEVLRFSIEVLRHAK
jgi:hypothetical protein